MSDTKPQLQPPTRKWLTRAEAAAYLKVHPRTITRAIKAKKVRAAKAGGQYRFLPEWLDAWMEHSLSAPTPKELT